MVNRDDVIASPVYNPQVDPTIVDLYKLMQAEEPDEKLLEEYRQIITSMPTQNPFKGVLYNPRACEVDLVDSIIDEIIDEITDRYQDIVADGTPQPPSTGLPGTNQPEYPGYTPSPDQVNDLEDWNNTFPGIIDDLNRGKDIVGDYKDHTDRIVSNLPSIIGMIQNQIGNTSASAGAGGNPCLPFADILGSILDAGRRILDQLLAALAMVKNAIQSALALIQQAMAQLMNAVNQALAMIQEEITKLAMAMLNMAKMGLAQLMSFLPSDPCLNAMLGGMITNAANGVMAKIGV